MALQLDQQTCRDLESAMQREWLVTNGLGGYASGTVSGVNTRRYHGLLVAALNPPVQRMVLVAALEEWVRSDRGDMQALSTQEYWDGTIYPQGYRQLDGLELDGMLPVFRWTLAGGTIEKRIWMEQGVSRTVITYRLLSGAGLTLQLRPLLAHRDYHQQRHGKGAVDVSATSDGWVIQAAGVRSHVAVRSSATVRTQPEWYWRVLHRLERERGLDDEEDLFTPGTVDVPLAVGADVAVILGTEPTPTSWDAGRSLRDAQQRQDAVKGPGMEHPLAGQLALAAEQFRVVRMAGNGASGPQRTVVAGYHWFTDWGRDTMISLPGLTMRPGTLWAARAVLDTYIRYLDQGLLPNRFPDGGQSPEYNTIDATLWLFQALAAYLRASRDWRFIADRLEALEAVIDWHVRGTRHNIRMDPVDGLLAGGDDGLALTWMDARVGDWVITPRRGKPIEVNALWYNALRLMADWCERGMRPAGPYRQMAAHAHASAQERFWFAHGGYCYDVVDAPDGDDPSLRPNQVIALALVYPLMEGEPARRVLDVVTEKLLTPYGLRTLSPDDPRYLSSYRGDQRARDAAYHMGLVWPWLLGPYLDARRRLEDDQPAVRRLLEPFTTHLREAGLGTISEIFEAEPPHRPVGCIAQAWSVSEVLRHVLALS